MFPLAFCAILLAMIFNNQFNAKDNPVILCIWKLPNFVTFRELTRAFPSVLDKFSFTAKWSKAITPSPKNKKKKLQKKRFIKSENNFYGINKLHLFCQRNLLTFIKVHLFNHWGNLAYICFEQGFKLYAVICLQNLDQYWLKGKTIDKKLDQQAVTDFQVSKDKN